MNAHKIITNLLFVALMLHAGGGFSRTKLLQLFSRRRLLASAFLANFVFVPAIAVLVARFFRLDETVATGFLLMAIAPGPASLPRAAGPLVGGSLELAVALSFLMPALSIVTVPLTAAAVLPGEQVARIPAVPLLGALLLWQFLPLLVGMFVAERAPKLSKRLSTFLQFFIAAAIVFLLVMIGPILARAVTAVSGSRGMLAIFVTVLLSMVVGWMLAGPESHYRRTLSITTALRNVGIALLIAGESFHEPLVEAMILLYLVIQGISALCLRLFFMRFNPDRATNAPPGEHRLRDPR